MYLEKAKEILEHEYKQHYAEDIEGFLQVLMNEKIRHSYQVLGVGKYLLRHEAYFANCSEEEQDFLQAVVLLHDVARFHEFLVSRQGQKIDHGIYGAEMLAKIPEFNKIEARLPIKHHGHLIECLYEDKEYQELSADVQERVQKITFLVRDADKLANFYLLVSKFEEMSPLFFSKRCFETPYKKDINSGVWNDFMGCKPVRMQYITNFAERALGFLSWIFDLNYMSSFIFMENVHIVDRMIDAFSLYFNKQDLKKCKVLLEEYITRKI